MHYYNENDPFASKWLRNLSRGGRLPAGFVDHRSIKEVKANELRGFDQHHFFAGIGGWPLALRLAGWPDDRPVWTGSCPCQPYSSAGKALGNKDHRNLWPDFFRLVRECRPATILGEQVESAIGHGWLDGISADLEGEGYAVGAIVLGAHSVGAPHIRQRLYWVAHAREQRFQRGASLEGGRRVSPERSQAIDNPGDSRIARGMGESVQSGLEGRRPGLRSEPGDGRRGQPSSEAGDARGMEYVASDGRIERGPEPGGRGAPGGCGDGFWDDFDLVPCRDGKSRRIEPGTFPLAHGTTGRVGLLRGYGNAIVVPLAVEFVRAFMDSRGEVNSS